MTGPSSPITILVVDDEPAIRAVLRQGLEAAGYAIAEAGNKTDLFHGLESGPVSLVTLDLGLGPEDGLELAREIRVCRNVPIVMITGRGAPMERVKGLEHGADEYIVKPFHVREVIIRVRNVLRRYAIGLEGSNTTGTGERLAFEAGVLDVGRRQYTARTGDLVDLTEIEFRILELFLRHPERVLSRDEISHELKGREWSPLDRTIDGHIARLRRKIEPEDGEEPVYIKTVRGVGYVFTGHVTALS